MDGFTPLTMACFMVAAAIALATFVVVAMHWSSLPAQIPRHYGLTGRPRWWSPKPVIWAYPVASLAVGVAMFVIIRADAGKAADHGSIQNMSFLAAYLSLVILATTVRTIAIAHKRAEGLGWWFAPMTLAGMLLLVFIAQH